MTEPEETPIVPPEVLDRLRQLSDEWRNVDANERASFQTWFLKFCEALEVPGPVPPHDDYRFELPVKVVDREGNETSNFIDCCKTYHFALEAKATGEEKPERALRRAFGQVRNYAAHSFGDSPPFLMVVDVPRTLIVWDRWSGSYGDFAAGKRIALLTLHERPRGCRTPARYPRQPRGPRSPGEGASGDSRHCGALGRSGRATRKQGARSGACGTLPDALRVFVLCRGCGIAAEEPV